MELGRGAQWVLVLIILWASVAFSQPVEPPPGVEVKGDLLINDYPDGGSAGLKFATGKRQTDAYYGTITGVAGTGGITGSGTSGNVTLSVNFGGDGTATTVSRSDHTHDFTSSFVNTTGDTMSGPLTLPANGLVAGATQFVLNNGNVGIGIGAPTEKLDLVGNLKMGGDIKTDRWQNSDTNTFMGVGVAGKGTLTLGYSPLGLYNTAVGNSALYSIYSGYSNTAFGREALYSTTAGRYNTAMGNSALRSNVTGTSNIALGEYALFSNVSGERNVAIGYLAGYASTGDRNLFLGYNAGYSHTGSDRLYIANSSATPLIYGQFDTKQVCIDCTDPEATLDVNGPVTVRTGDVKLNGAGSGVVFPDGSRQTKAAGYVRTVLVSPGETATESGARLLDALDGITGNGSEKPYLVKIEPGIYDVGASAVQMKDYVDIEGSGENTTVIKGRISDFFSGVVMGANNAELRLLTVQNVGPGHYAVAVHNHLTSPKMSNVTVIASGATDSYGVLNWSSSSKMTNVTVNTSGAMHSYGVYNTGSATPEMTHVTTTGSLAANNYGTYNESSSPTMNNVTASASGGTYNYGVYNKNCPATPPLTMINVTATASGSSGSVNYGVFNESSSLTIINVTATASGLTGSNNTGLRNYSSGTVIINHSVIKGTQVAVFTASAVTTRIGNTQLEGGVSGTGVICAGVYDGNYTFHASTCP